MWHRYAADRFDTSSLQHERGRRTAARQHRPRCIASRRENSAYGTSFIFEKVGLGPNW